MGGHPWAGRGGAQGAQATALPTRRHARPWAVMGGTPVKCREAGSEIAPVLPVPVVHCTVSVQLYSTENDWENDCARYGLMRHLLIFCPSSSVLGK